MGAVSNGDGSDKTAIFIRASAILGYYLAKSKNKNHFKGNRFGLLDLVNPKVGKQALVGQLKVDEHSTPDGQRDLDPPWYDDEAEDMAEAIRASMGEADQAVGQWVAEEEEKRDEGRQTAKWFRDIGIPGGHSEAYEKKKGGRRRPDRDGGDREQIDRGDWHDGTNLEPVKVDQDEAHDKTSTIEKEVEQVGSADKKEKTQQQAAARPLGKFAKICCLGALFWGAVDVHGRLRKSELTDAEKQKKREIIFNLTEKFPLSQFEREFCSIHTFNDEPKPFAYDSKGNLLLEEVGVAGKSRIDVGSRKKKNKKKKDSSIDNATKITESLKEKLGFDFKPVAAETGHKARRDSLIANCLKAIPDKFVPDEDHLKAFEAVHLVPFSPPNLADEAEVERLIRDAICNMDKTRSSGSDCFSRGHNLKGSFLEADILSIIDATKRRIARLGYVGKDIGLFSGAELVQYGLRGVVMPSIKGEWHTEKKIFEMVKQEDGTEVAKRDADGKRIRLAHPRWRTILMQSTIEYATQFVLFKGKVNAQVKVLQEGSIDDAIGQYSSCRPRQPQSSISPINSAQGFYHPHLQSFL